MEEIDKLDDTDEDDSASHSDESVAEEADTESHRDDKVSNSYFYLPVFLGYI